MAIVTTFMTTPLLYWVYPQRLLEREIKEAEKAEAPGAAEKVHPFTVLIPVADPRSSGSLLQMANLISLASENRRILALHLRQPVDRPEFRTGLREAREPLPDEPLRVLVNRAKQDKISVEPLSFYSQDVARDIAKTARDRQANLVLIGFHKPVFSRTVLGGTVHRVMTATPTDVAVFVDRGMLAPHRVLVPFMGGQDKLSPA